jgi:hypothetical protein
MGTGCRAAREGPQRGSIWRVKKRSSPSDCCGRDPAVGPGRWRRTAFHALQTFIITTYALASRLRASWIEARVTKVASVSARFSKSWARRRAAPPLRQRGSRMSEPVDRTTEVATAAQAFAEMLMAVAPATRDELILFVNHRLAEHGLVLQPLDRG